MPNLPEEPRSSLNLTGLVRVRVLREREAYLLRHQVLAPAGQRNIHSVGALAGSTYRRVVVRSPAVEDNSHPVEDNSVEDILVEDIDCSPDRILDFDHTARSGTAEPDYSAEGSRGLDMVPRRSGLAAGRLVVGILGLET
jgi:hypothetical protein